MRKIPVTLENRPFSGSEQKSDRRRARSGVGEAKCRSVRRTIERSRGENPRCARRDEHHPGEAEFHGQHQGRGDQKIESTNMLLNN